MNKVTSRRIVRLAQKAMKRASKLTAAEVRSLAGSVLAQADKDPATAGRRK